MSTASNEPRAAAARGNGQASLLPPSEALYQQLVESQPDLICRFLPDTTLTYVNAAYARFFGRQPEDLIGCRWIDFLAPEDRDLVRGQLASLVPSGPARQYVHQTVRDDGTPCWHLWHDTAFFDAEGTVAAVQSVGVDITDRKRVEQRLERLNAVFLSLGDDLDGNLQQLAALCGELLGAACAFYNRREAGQIHSVAQWQPPEGYEAVRASETHICHHILQAAKDATVVITSLPQTTHARTNPDVLRNGFEVYVGHPVFLRGQAIGVLCLYYRHPASLSVEDQQLMALLAFAISTQEERRVTRDEQRHLQLELAQAQKLESVGRLAGGIAHDFNNQLTVISGLAQMIEMAAQNDPALREDARGIVDAARASAELVRKLLGYARKQTAMPVTMDLNQAVKGLFPQLQQLVGDVQFSWFPGKGLWPLRLDPTQFDQILAQLLTNARHAITGPGSITLETENVTLGASARAWDSDATPGDYVCITVRDDGCGMEPEVLQKAFEPFFTTKGIGTATGLGLSTVYGIVKQNQGLIHAESTPGQGSVFRVFFPRTAPATATSLNGAEQEDVPGGHGETILLVEDEEPVLNLTRKVLEKTGYRVLATHSSAEALRLAREYSGRIDLLLTDVIMPEMDGPALAERLRTQQPGVPCLFMSGFTAEAIAAGGGRLDAAQFLRKPFSIEELSAAVRGALAGSSEP